MKEKNLPDDNDSKSLEKLTQEINNIKLTQAVFEHYKYNWGTGLDFGVAVAKKYIAKYIDFKNLYY